MAKYIFLCFFMVSYLLSVEAQVYVNSISQLQTEITNASGDITIKFGPGFPATLPDIISTTAITHEYDIVIDGEKTDGTSIELTCAPGKRHFNISKSTSATGGIITFKNIIFKGLRTSIDISTGNGGASGGGINIDAGYALPYKFENVLFSSINGSALSASGNVDIVNSTFENNYTGGHGAAITGTGDMNIAYCTFTGNVSDWSGYSGGAIGVNSHSGTINIKRSVFLENRSATRGGAISSHNGNNCSLIIDECYFEGNKTTTPTGNADGGAVSVYGAAGVIFELSNSTFYRNRAADDGGAVFIENHAPGASNLIVNCTMFENCAEDVNPATASGLNVATAGGAIQASVTSVVTLKSNTIVRNYTTSTYRRGGGLGIHANTLGVPTFILKNNIILGNYIFDINEIHNNHANIGRALLSAVITNNGGNLGIDNGTALPSGYNIGKYSRKCYGKLSIWLQFQQ